MDYWNNDRIGLAQNMRPMLSLNRVAQPIKFIVSGLYYNNNNRAEQVLIGGRWYSLHPASPPPSFINSSRYLSPPPLCNSVRAFPSNNKDSSCMQRMNSISGEGLIDINSADHSLVASCAIGKNGQSKVVDSSPLIKSFRRSSPCLDNYSTIQDLSGTIAPMPLLRRYNGELWNDIQPPPLCWRIHLENYITTKNLKGREGERIKMIIKNPLSATQELLDQLVLNNFPCVSRCIHYLSTEVLLFKHQLKCAKAFFVRDWLSSDQEARKHYQHVYCSYFCAPSCEHRRAIRHRVHSKSCDSDSESDVDGAVGVTVCGDLSATVNDASESDYHSDNSAEDISDYLSDDDGENNELLNGEEGEELEEDIDSKEEEIDDQQCDDDHNDEEIEEEQEECDGEECENINDGECEEQFSEEELENNIDEFPDHD